MDKKEIQLLNRIEQGRTTVKDAWYLREIISERATLLAAHSARVSHLRKLLAILRMAGDA